VAAALERTQLHRNIVHLQQLCSRCCALVQLQMGAVTVVVVWPGYVTEQHSALSAMDQSMGIIFIGNSAILALPASFGVTNAPSSMALCKQTALCLAVDTHLQQWHLHQAPATSNANAVLAGGAKVWTDRHRQCTEASGAGCKAILVTTCHSLLNVQINVTRPDAELSK
jgi:hypothetical protein